MRPKWFMIMNLIDGKMDFTIFYAWQSDSPNGCNWSFIQNAIEKAIKRINKNVQLELAPRIDRDTKNESGTPAIADTIAEKIRASGMVVADVTLVGTTDDDMTVWMVLWTWVKSRFSRRLTIREIIQGKRLPNPNVAIEVGEAAEAIGWDRVILVMNTHYGRADDIPFDLKHRRFPIRYELSPNATDEQRRIVKEELVKNLEKAILDAAAAEHRQVQKAISRLDIDCLLIISMLRNASFFRDIAQDQAMLNAVQHIIDVPRFHTAIRRLLDLGLIYTDVVAPKYAYHWTTLGKMVVGKLNIQNLLTQPPINPPQGTN